MPKKGLDINYPSLTKDIQLPQSLLENTILDVFAITENENNKIWSYFENLTFTELTCLHNDWDRLQRYAIYKEDSLDTILALSLEYIFELWPEEPYFDLIINHIVGLVENTIKKRLSLKKLYSDDFPLLYPLNNLFISPTLVPQDLLKELHNYGIYKWNDLNNLSEATIINKYGLTAKSMRFAILHRRILSIVEKVAFLLKQSNFESKEDSTWKRFMRNWLSKRIKNNRDIKIVLQRMGWDGTEALTLEAVGEHHGLTRERIRQIELKYTNTLGHKPSRVDLYPFWIIIDSILYEYSGIMSFKEIVERFCSHFNESGIISEDGFKNLCMFLPKDLSPKLILHNEETYIVSKDFVCNNCSSLSEYLFNLITEAQVLSINNIINNVNEYCNKTCTRIDRNNNKFSESFFYYCAEQDEKLKNIIRKKDGNIYHIDRWKIQHGKRIDLVESILKEQKKPMHFSEILSEIKNLRPKDSGISERDVHAALTRSNNTVLWDRGTFIHRECAPFPFGLIRQIERWLRKKLKQNVPFVAVYGAFSVFQDECIKTGISTETALYMTLKRSADPSLFYPHYPYIYLNDGKNNTISITQALEGFIKTAQGVIELKKIRRYASEQLHIKDFTLSQHLARIPEILHTKNGYIHVDYLNIDNRILSEIIEYIEATIMKLKHLSITLIFNEKRVLCKLLGIDSPELLYSILQLYAGDRFNLNNYPQIRTGSKSVAKRWGMIDDIVLYIRRKNTFCTRQELHNYFVEERGYSEQSIYLVGLRDDIFQYFDGCLIHKDVIDWDQQKQEELESIALSLYKEEVNSGKYYALIDFLVESIHLKDLQAGLVWNNILLSDILSKSGKFKIIGSRKNAFVSLPNQFHIESLADLVCEILRKEENGAASLDLFSEKLVDLGIIVNRLTDNMLGGSEKVYIIGKEIMLKELLKNA